MNGAAANVIDFPTRAPLASHVVTRLQDMAAPKHMDFASWHPASCPQCTDFGQLNDIADLHRLPRHIKQVLRAHAEVCDGC